MNNGTFGGSGSPPNRFTELYSPPVSPSRSVQSGNSLGSPYRSLQQQPRPELRPDAYRQPRDYQAAIGNQATAGNQAATTNQGYSNNPTYNGNNSGFPANSGFPYGTSSDYGSTSGSPVSGSPLTGSPRRSLQPLQPLQHDNLQPGNLQQVQSGKLQPAFGNSPNRNSQINGSNRNSQISASNRDSQISYSNRNSQINGNSSPLNGSPVANSNAPASNYVYFARHPEKFSRSSQDRAAAVKLTLEHFYKTAIEHAIERNQRRIKFEQRVGGEISAERRNRETQLFSRNESQYLRLRRTRLSLEDFHTVKVIGKGAFGEVRLVQKRDTGKIYAMKTLLKSEMYKKDQLAHVKAERDVLADADSPWVVSLYYSFQDKLYLYLIMEFLPGGDLMTMLIKWQIFTEDVTRFYIAECVLAIEAIHKLGFIHRDIKPDNILIDRRGHIKLSDFGLSTGFHKTHDSNYYKKLLAQEPVAPASGRNTVTVDPISLTMTNRQQMQTWRKSRRLMAYSTVGTPDYIAPEIFVNKGYGQECDWWSLGAIMFECLVGWPPFCSETPAETYRKIINWRQTLQFPEDVHLSPEAQDLILRLLTDADHRLGCHGADEIKRHPFFRGVNWDMIRQVEAPFIPKLRSITDTRFFPTDELQNVPDSPALAQAEKERERLKRDGLETKADLPFIGYTFSRFEYLTKTNAI